MAIEIGGGITIGGGISIEPEAPPVITITGQPSNQSTYATGTATFSVTATVTRGATLTYQWQKQESGIGAWNTVVGATSSSYTTGALSVASDNGDKYRVVVSASGASDVTSNSATLTVTAAVITISSQPSPATASYGSTATFSVSASVTQSATLSYQWQLDPGSGTFSDIGGATSSSYTTGTLSSSENNYVYRVVVSANRGASPVTSNEVLLTVSGGGGATITGTILVSNSGGFYGGGGPLGAGTISMTPAAVDGIVYISGSNVTIVQFKANGTYGSVTLDGSGLNGTTTLGITVNSINQSGGMQYGSAWQLVLSGDPWNLQNSVGQTFNVSMN